MVKQEKTEREKMLAGEVYDATADALVQELNAMKDLVWEYNRLRPSQMAERTALLKKMLGRCDDDTFIVQPFYCDYGKQIRLGKRFYANFGWTVLDEAFVTIGDDCFIGPNVSIYTACHPIDPIERNTRQEYAKPVTIGDNVWIGGSATILPGVSIGDNVTIGAGSVVTKDVESNTVVAGNPAKIIRRIQPSNEKK